MAERMTLAQTTQRPMNRVQKRCFVASVTLHGMLLALVLFGSAFFSSRAKQDEDLPVLTFIPDMAGDSAFVGGGSRSAVPPTLARSNPSPPPTPAVAPARVERTEPTPPLRTERRAPEPAPAPAPRDRTVRAETAVADKPAKPRFELPKTALQAVEKKPTSARSNTRPPPSRETTTANTDTTQDMAARGRLASTLRNSLARINAGVSGSTTVESPGEGTGGPSYAPYAAIVKAIYTEAWQPPADLQDEQATTDAEIEVARDGTVISAHITRPSGDARMDRSIQETLNRVKSIKEFPPSWKEQRRTFQIRFNLQAKEQLLG
jgi:TonB family protein